MLMLIFPAILHQHSRFSHGIAGALSVMASRVKPAEMDEKMMRRDRWLDVFWRWLLAASWKAADACHWWWVNGHEPLWMLDLTLRHCKTHPVIIYVDVSVVVRWQGRLMITGWGAWWWCTMTFRISTISSIASDDWPWWGNMDTDSELEAPSLSLCAQPLPAVLMTTKNRITCFELLFTITMQDGNFKKLISCRTYWAYSTIYRLSV